jgi:hypothetical protein
MNEVVADVESEKPTLELLLVHLENTLLDEVGA